MMGRAERERSPPHRRERQGGETLNRFCYLLCCKYDTGRSGLQGV